MNNPLSGPVRPLLPMSRVTTVLVVALTATTLLTVLRSAVVATTLWEGVELPFYGVLQGTFLVSLFTIFTFFTWSKRARYNAQEISDRPHRWGYSWLTFGWVLPGFHLWVPRRALLDIALGSDPADPAALRREVNLWWAAYLAMDATSGLTSLLLEFLGATTGRLDFLDSDEALLVGAAATVLAAVAAIRMITSIAGLQAKRADPALAPEHSA